jgi:hypothetical protein
VTSKYFRINDSLEKKRIEQASARYKLSCYFLISLDFVLLCRLFLRGKLIISEVNDFSEKGSDHSKGLNELLSFSFQFNNKQDLF